MSKISDFFAKAPRACEVKLQVVEDRTVNRITMTFNQKDDSLIQTYIRPLTSQNGIIAICPFELEILDLYNPYALTYAVCSDISSGGWSVTIRVLESGKLGSFNLSEFLV